MTLINKVYSLAICSTCISGLGATYSYLNKVDAPTEAVEIKEEATTKSNGPAHLEWVEGKGLGGGNGDSGVDNISPM